MQVTAVICCILATMTLLAAGLPASRSAPEERPECIRCVPKHRPVCGRDSGGRMQTFANACQLRRDNCLHHTDFNQVRKGSC